MQQHEPPLFSACQEMSKYLPKCLSTCLHTIMSSMTGPQKLRTVTVGRKGLPPFYGYDSESQENQRSCMKSFKGYLHTKIQYYTDFPSTDVLSLAHKPAPHLLCFQAAGIRKRRAQSWMTVLGQEPMLTYQLVWTVSSNPQKVCGGTEQHIEVS